MNTFSNKEKLKSGKMIQALFGKDSNEKFAYPLMVKYMILQENEREGTNPQISVSVSKKKFKKAVDRNKIKRLIREAYRLSNKDLKNFTNLNNTSMAIMFIYIANVLEPYTTVQKGMLKVLNQIQK